MMNMLMLIVVHYLNSWPKNVALNYIVKTDLYYYQYND